MVRLIIFAKAPLPGLAKTRLIPALGEAGSAQLARQLLQHTVAQAVAADVGSVELCVTPSAELPIWPQLALPAGLLWAEQGEGDLGQRMAHACERALTEGCVPILLGCDCPGLTSALLRQAAQALQEYDCCMVPAVDGGYALLGMRRFVASVFTDMPWSTAEVAALTEQRLLAAGLSVKHFATEHDIDEAADLQWLPTHLKRPLIKRLGDIGDE